MAKKKSKRFIIPAFHFLTTAPLKKEPEKYKVVKPSSSQQIKQPSEVARTETQKRPARNEVHENPAKELIKPKPLEIKSQGRRNSALSLSSLKRDKEVEEKLKKKKNIVEDTQNLPKDPFTEATFIDVWTSYIDNLHSKGEKILASILKADTPKLKGILIHVTYPNELMKIELLKVRPRVLRHIREQLNNYSVDFKITVNEDNTKRFAYTPQEKYELLKEKNEALTLLRKTFNLEL